MEKIYVCHSRKIDFEKELYLPLEKSLVSENFNLILPHKTKDFINSKFIFEDKSCKYLLCVLSSPTMSMGIELGWADLLNVKIIFIYKKDDYVSKSWKTVSNIFIEYENSKDLIIKLEAFFNL